MAPQPKRKHSQRRGRVRAMALRLSMPRFTACPSCKKLREPHKVCPHCGYYDGRVFIEKKEEPPAGSQGKGKDESSK